MGRPMICGGGCAWPGRGSTFRRTYLAAPRSLYEVRCRLRAVCSAAQTVRDGGRPLPVAGQRAGLGVSRQVILNKAGSAVPLVPPRKAHILVRGLCGSAEAVLQRRVLSSKERLPILP